MGEKEKKISAAKQLAIENYKYQTEQLTRQGFTAHEALISVFRANLMAVVLSAPFIIAFVYAFVTIWNKKTEAIPIGFLILWLLFIPVHELLHGIGWSLFCKNRFKSIRFGIMWSSLTPYCACNEPLGFLQYLVGGIAPFFLLGLIPSLLGVFIGSFQCLTFGLLGILAAGGDMSICLNMLKYKNALFLDHPTSCGFAAFSSPEKP